MPATWTRETPWRQGHALPRKAIEALKLVADPELDTACVIVITHDCDLANDNLEAEPEVEVIVGKVIAACSGNFSWGKAPRTLHLPMIYRGEGASIQLVQTEKRRVPKNELAAFSPDADWTMSGKGLSTLRSWLASRYNRAAFPDTFVNRMNDSKASEKLAKALQPYGELISFVYFDLDGGQNIEREDGDVYQLSVVLVYVVEDDADDAADQADEAVEAIERALSARLGEKVGVALKACFSMSEDDLPVSKARVLTQWRLEHMTHRADEAQPVPPEL